MFALILTVLIEPSKNLTQYYYSTQTKTGPAIWKFAHYLPIYEKHFAKFVDTDVHVLEVGIHSGGSLRMWRHFFGTRAVIMGMDRLNATRRFEGDPYYGRPDRVFVGDQSSTKFWDTFKERVKRLDILIDDGGHRPHLQRATATAMIPFLSPGGIYLCEDLNAKDHNAQLRWFYEYVGRHLHEYRPSPLPSGHTGDYFTPSSRMQQIILSLTYYPLQVVIEKRREPLRRMENEAFGGQHIGSSSRLFSEEQKNVELRNQFLTGYISV